MARNKKANAKWRIEARRARALMRQEARNGRSALEQMNLLNERLGVAIGAKKERERLCKLI